jgi:hypothetical protein
VGSLSWLSKETRCDIAGKVSLLQQSFPNPMIKDIIEANKAAEDVIATKEQYIKIRSIPLERLRLGVATDAAWGNAKEAGDFLERNSKDTWEETSTQWIRHHVVSRRILFHPGAAPGGPDLHDLQPTRRTTTSSMEETDEWNHSKSFRKLGQDQWTGKTYFTKMTGGKELEATNIHESFLQLERLSSQAGYILFFYDALLETAQTPQATSIIAWKSYKLKRKTVSTLSAESQSLMLGLGVLHWHRFLLLEVLMGCKVAQWESEAKKMPFFAAVDSKSVYDAVSRCVNPASQMEDKRNAIDLAVIKHELETGSGRIRWIDTRAMIADPLTKGMDPSYLRFVMTNGKWTVAEEGRALQQKLMERTAKEEAKQADLENGNKKQKNGSKVPSEPTETEAHWIMMILS